MRLKNKKTGEIVEVELCNSTTGTIGLFFAEGRECDRAYNSLAELNEEWEDYRPLEEFWFINSEMSVVQQSVDCDKFNREIGNYFETKEEAEKAVEKLKAWKRLKDKGFRFTSWKRDEQFRRDYYITAEDCITCDDNDLNLLFGGEE